jgi:hypothetical protein
MKSIHTNCTHDSTTAARKRCRRATTDAARLRLAEGNIVSPRDIVRHFAGVDHAGLSRYAVARDILDYIASAPRARGVGGSGDRA